MNWKNINNNNLFWSCFHWCGLKIKTEGNRGGEKEISSKQLPCGYHEYLMAIALRKIAARLGNEVKNVIVNNSFECSRPLARPFVSSRRTLRIFSQSLSQQPARNRFMPGNALELALISRLFWCLHRLHARPKLSKKKVILSLFSQLHNVASENEKTKNNATNNYVKRHRCMPMSWKNVLNNCHTLVRRRKELQRMAIESCNFLSLWATDVREEWEKNTKT